MKNIISYLLPVLLLLSFESAFGQIEWVAYQGSVPDNAILGSSEGNLEFPVCRCIYKEGKVAEGKYPGTIKDGKCSIAWRGKEVLVSSFEVLVGDSDNIVWQEISGHTLPDKTVKAGYDESNRDIYVGRIKTKSNGTQTGKVYKSGKKYISSYGYGGKENYKYQNFEVLVVEIKAPEEYYRIDNLKNPRFVKLDNEKAKSFVGDVDKRFEENEKIKKKLVFPKNFKIPDMGHDVYAIKLDEGWMCTYYLDTEMMNPNAKSYNPTRAGNVVEGRSSIPRYGDELKGGQADGFVIIKARGLDTANPPKKLTDWVKNNLNGIFGYSTPKLKLSVSSKNELSFCLGLGKIHTFKEQNGKLNKVRSLDLNGDLIAFTRGDDDKYCIVTSDGKSDNTNMHSFKGAKDKEVTKNLKLWDKYKQDKLKGRPYPTLDYANGEYLFQYYLHTWEASMNTNLHSSSFRLKIKDDGSVEPRTWQTSHTFGMDALHNGTDWISVYSTDGDYFLNHPGVFIDKVNDPQKALLFSSPQRWAERGQGDAAHGQMNYFYTGMGGIAYSGNGYGVVFNNPKMKKAPSDLPQNVGFVYVKEDFETTTRRKNGDLSTVDPTGNLSNNGVQDNVTIYCERMNTEPVNYKRKVSWLSNYTSIENGFSNNTDIVAIGNKFIVVWEKWAKVGEEKDWGEMVPVWDYLGTEAVVIDKKGNILSSKSLGKHPLNNWDDLRVHKGKVVWATFDNANFSVQINTLDINLKHVVKTLSLP